ncbi:MAG: hypothetical protein BAJALOKI1v1_1310002 [Promethearchaeota archaeon]|nr:MAG: hypothetical protein BAJALOKI1v1_1310002 [Candidatus Lokiarchaeota archaeon]
MNMSYKINKIIDFHNILRCKKQEDITSISKNQIELIANNNSFNILIS